MMRGYSPDPKMNLATVFISLDFESDETEWEPVWNDIKPYLTLPGWAGAIYASGWN